LYQVTRPIPPCVTHCQFVRSVTFSHEVAVSRAVRGRVGVKYPVMNEEYPRRRPPLADDASAPIGESTRRMSAHERGAGSGWTSTTAAARALAVSRRTVQSYAQQGILDSKSEGEGVKKTLYISIDSLNTLRARRIAEGKIGADASEDASIEHGAELVEVVQNLSERLADAAARAAEYQTRLELTARAESTLREQLEMERQHRLEDVQRERAERLVAQQRAEELRQEAEEAARRSEGLEAELGEADAEARRLREEIEMERSKGFWRRLFGG
jgi:hypothetical protein